MKKLKLLPSMLMLVACIAILGVGVFAVAPTQNTISGTITINSANPEVRITVFGYNADGTMNTETPIMAETPARSGVNIDLKNLSFDTSTCNTEEDLAKLDIKITIRISNPSSTKLGVYFSENVVSGDATTDDVKTEKQLTDSTTAKTNVKAVMDGYKELVEKSGEINGSVDTTITFKLLKFMSSDASVDLSATANQMYLNIETFNDDFIPPVVIGEGKTTISSVDVPAGATKVQIADGVLEIEDNTFKDCTTLKQVIFADSVYIVGTNVFKNCTSLQYNQDENDEKLFYLGSETNPYFYLAYDIYVDDGSSSDYTRIILNTRTKVVGAKALYFDIMNTEFILPDGIVAIGENACASINCGKINNIPSSLRYVADGGLSGGAGNMYINGSLDLSNIEYIGAMAFVALSAVDDFTIYNKTKFIGKDAFMNSTATQITFKAGTTLTTAYVLSTYLNWSDIEGWYRTPDFQAGSEITEFISCTQDFTVYAKMS